MLSVKVREAADTIFKVIGMTILRIKPSLPFFAGERSNYKPTKQAKFLALARLVFANVNTKLLTT